MVFKKLTWNTYVPGFDVASNADTAEEHEGLSLPEYVYVRIPPFTQAARSGLHANFGMHTRHVNPVLIRIETRLQILLLSKISIPFGSTIMQHSQFRCEHRGRTWSDCETRLLLDLWGEDEIQCQLRSTVRNDRVFQKIVLELANTGFQRTVAQCRAKVKALSKKYKEIVDSLGRSGAGCESDEEVYVPTDCPYFSVMDAVLGGRASVMSVYTSAGFCK